MDFSVPAPVAGGPGVAANLSARGNDPAIAIPAGQHFFRRINGLVLSPIPGALAPLPTTIPQSLVELVLLPTVTTNRTPALEDQAIFLSKVAPAKLDAALAQLEAEPAGVGLSPTKVYADFDEPCAAPGDLPRSDECQRLCVRRWRTRPRSGYRCRQGPLHRHGSG